jgi:hypothetical protein
MRVNRGGAVTAPFCEWVDAVGEMEALLSTRIRLRTSGGPIPQNHGGHGGSIRGHGDGASADSTATAVSNSLSLAAPGPQASHPQALRFWRQRLQHVGQEHATDGRRQRGPRAGRRASPCPTLRLTPLGSTCLRTPTRCRSTARASTPGPPHPPDCRPADARCPCCSVRRAAEWHEPATAGSRPKASSGPCCRSGRLGW